jgi:ankyrin repeat protein
VDAQATVQHTIAAGRHLDLIPEHYGLALDSAAFYGYTDLVELLLNEGTNCDQGYALETAVFYGHAAIVELLLAVPNVDPNVMFGIFYILAHSAFDGDDAIVKLLLGHPDIDPNCVSGDADGKSALMLGSTLAVVKLLLGREDIDVNKQDTSGCTALMHYIKHARYDEGGEYEECAKLLLNRDDVDVSLTDGKGQTALFWACKYEYDNISIVDLLLKKEGIDPNARNIDGCTPLGCACYFHGVGRPIMHLNHLNNVAKMRLFLSYPDTDPNPVDNDGVSLLSHVVLSVTPLYGGLMELLLRAAGVSQRCIQY